MTDPIMSRFDMFFVLVDRIDAEKDEMIARHILASHSDRQEMADCIARRMTKLAKLLRFARLIEPVFTLDAMQVLRNA